ncbi:hypothetical protein KHQ81_02510 [Mycoplasmatota bacterium]|nr:hypothetical protein KHQ81_02510 [Mycoplasmatota bacterium]
MKKYLFVLLCLYLFQSNHLTDVKDDIQKLIFPNQTNTKENSNKLYEQLLSLEEIYNDKLMIAHGIDPIDLKEKSAEILDYEKREEFRKNYIMEKADLTEQEYHDIFVHPLSQITNTKETTINDIKIAYEEIQEKIDNLENLIELINP